MVQMLDPLTSAPVLGLTSAAFAFFTLRTATDTSLTLRVFPANSTIEVGGGYYIITIPLPETAATGLVAYQFSAASAVPVYGAFYVEPAPVALTAAPQMCLLTGNVVEIGGYLTSPVMITCKTSSVPALVGGTSLLSTHRAVTWTDALGNFSISLLRGATVSIEILDCGIKGQFIVPAQQTASLPTLIPV